MLCLIAPVGKIGLSSDDYCTLSTGLLTKLAITDNDNNHHHYQIIMLMIQV